MTEQLKMKEYRKKYYQLHQQDLIKRTEIYYQENKIILQARRKLKLALECEKLNGISKGTIKRQEEANAILNNLPDDNRV